MVNIFNKPSSEIRCAVGVTNISTESEIDIPSSNPEPVCWVHFHTDDLNTRIDLVL